VMGGLAGWGNGGEIAIGVVAVADHAAIGQGLRGYPVRQVICEKS
jgi:hypothetical protein